MEYGSQIVKRKKKFMNAITLSNILKTQTKNTLCETVSEVPIQGWS